MVEGSTVVISDAGPLIALARIEQLDLLHALFTRVVVPVAVWNEVVVAGGHDAPGAREVRAATWIDVVAPSHVDPRLARLGLGEAEAISLAASIPGALLLLDDGAGRAHAIGAGLPVLGTLGVLRRAKIAGLLPAVRPLIEDLQRRDFRASARLIEAILKDVGELDD